ncbi:type I phosphomannose isomerase catalytic subunit [Selenomonas ruminis]|uniref:Phosphohexomutase n=1 Tax=Selenomonas ruminis TaxID=2593411 RepID=A0A5D6W156_9FIRM|nr:type I phosphomannose isomerase catalytic subunit [Selenomonas sp. mPRGC5]TYZ20494.1 class I mannose-6-phosphate isomerase [Selenomonas sp. mPRGC5]
MFYPLKLKAPLKDYLWGGTRLKHEYHKETDLDKVAESWELSCHQAGLSMIENGEAKGKTLAEFIQEQGKDVLGRNAEKFSYFPLLIKLIDARDNLSVQVHPDNDYALRVEGEYGKTEMWYIVDCEPGASLLYGFKQEITPDEFARRIADNTLLEVCNQVPVKKGDVFFIEAGTLHAIGKGILICEIQQNSNTTYRIYDYGRVGKDGKPRELHVEKAKEVTKLAPPTRDTKPLAALNIFADAKASLLASCEYFTAYHFELNGCCPLRCGEESFQALTVIRGEMEIVAEGGKTKLLQGETAFLPAKTGKYQVSGKGAFILSSV